MIGLMCLKDANETTDSCKCCICHYWYFLKKNIRFQPKACNACLDLVQKEFHSFCKFFCLRERLQNLFSLRK